MDVEELLRKYAVKNAVEHGKAQQDAVIGKVFAEQPELKEDAGQVVQQAQQVIADVNQLSDDDLQAAADEFEYADHSEEDDDSLPPLDDAADGVVMRMAPFPSGMLHIGNARMAVLNDEYVKRYGGTLYLVIDDTAGSAEKKPLPSAYEEIPKDLEWLGVEFDEVVYKSDRLDLFYEYGETFLREGWAYVCECDAETLRENRRAGEACSHREQSAEENLAKWEKMLAGDYEQGDAVVRLKTDMQHKDAAFRDRVLLRISELDHPRVGKQYHVWPMLEFSWGIDDHELGMTHIIRGKDLVMEDKMEQYMWNLLGWDHPDILHHGLLNIEGVTISTSTSKAKIDDGAYTGWDDPRTWSLKSLKKRGFEPEAIRNFVLEFGLSDTDVTVPVDTLYQENRQLIDEDADRYFFVEEPHVPLVIQDAPDDLEANIPNHPDADRGHRTYTFDGAATVSVQREDLEAADGFLRLKDLCNVTLEDIDTDAERVTATFHSRSHEPALERDAPIVQWVPANATDCHVTMPDGDTAAGLVEPRVPEEVIQFVRFGFVNVLDNEGPVNAFYTHP